MDSPGAKPPRPATEGGPPRPNGQPPARSTPDRRHTGDPGAGPMESPSAAKRPEGRHESTRVGCDQRRRPEERHGAPGRARGRSRPARQPTRRQTPEGLPTPAAAAVTTRAGAALAVDLVAAPRGLVLPRRPPGLDLRDRCRASPGCGSSAYNGLSIGWARRTLGLHVAIRLRGLPVLAPSGVRCAGAGDASQPLGGGHSFS